MRKPRRFDPTKYLKNTLTTTAEVENILEQKPEEQPYLGPHNNILHCAAAAGNLEIVDKILSDEQSATSVDSKNDNHETALMFAASNGHLDVVNTLIKKGANRLQQTKKEGHTALIRAIMNMKPNMDIVRELLNYDQQTEDLKKLIDTKDNTGKTALMFASLNGHLKVVETLIEKEANILEKTEEGYTALMFASLNGHLKVVETLIKQGANILEKTKEGYTALMFASLNGHLKVVETLIKQGANILEKTKEGYTALMFANANGHQK